LARQSDLGWSAAAATRGQNDESGEQVFHTYSPSSKDKLQ
jgi:hypothetical protein